MPHSHDINWGKFFQDAMTGNQPTDSLVYVLLQRVQLPSLQDNALLSGLFGNRTSNPPPFMSDTDLRAIFYGNRKSNYPLSASESALNDLFGIRTNNSSPAPRDIMSSDLRDIFIMSLSYPASNYDFMYDGYPCRIVYIGKTEEKRFKDRRDEHKNGREGEPPKVFDYMLVIEDGYTCKDAIEREKQLRKIYRQGHEGKNPPYNDTP